MNRNVCGKIKSFSIGLPKKMKYGEDKEVVTAICKETVEEALLEKEGFVGDDVADLRFHGGPDRAVCVYSYEHYSFWEKEFGSPLPSSAFGENLLVENMLEQNVCIGDVFQIGEAVIQITQGRVPCHIINKRTSNEVLLKRMVETGYTGYLCRVIKEGTVRYNSEITLIEPHPKQISIDFANQVYFHRPKDIDGIKRILDVVELAEEWQKPLFKRLESLSKSI